MNISDFNSSSIQGISVGIEKNPKNIQVFDKTRQCTMILIYIVALVVIRLITTIYF